MENPKLAPKDFFHLAQSLVAGVLEQCGLERNLEVELDEETGGFMLESWQGELFYQILAWNDEENVHEYTFSSHAHSHFDPKRPEVDKRIEIVGHSDFPGILVTMKKTLEAKR